MNKVAKKVKKALLIKQLKLNNIMLIETDDEDINKDDLVNVLINVIDYLLLMED